MPTEFKNVYLTEALESIQAEKRVSIQEMDNHTEVLEGVLRTKTDNLKEELEASVSLAMKVPILKDVNAMKVADGLLDGDVVQLQGYSSAGDGLHHMRKLSTVDDGTGILLPSGLYANYVKDSRSADKLDKTIYDNEMPKINEEITTIKEEIVGVKEDVYSTLPIGTILAIGHNEIPLGFLLCDGRAITESEYPELYRLYGSNIPDYRNMFLRGNTAGREIGSLQGDAIRNIKGNLRLTGSGNAGFYDTTYSDSPLFAHSTDTTSTQLTSQSGTGTTKRLIGFDASRAVPTADENRPKNISVNYIIKATNVVNPSSVVDVAEELNRKIESVDNRLNDSTVLWTGSRSVGGTITLSESFDNFKFLVFEVDSFLEGVNKTHSIFLTDIIKTNNTSTTEDQENEYMISGINSITSNYRIATVYFRDNKRDIYTGDYSNAFLINVIGVGRK